MFSFPVLLATLAGVASATPFFGRGLPSLATRAITIEGTNCTCKGYSFSDPGFNGGEAVPILYPKGTHQSKGYCWYNGRFSIDLLWFATRDNQTTGSADGVSAKQVCAFLGKANDEWTCVYDLQDRFVASLTIADVDKCNYPPTHTPTACGCESECDRSKAFICEATGECLPNGSPKDKCCTKEQEWCATEEQCIPKGTKCCESPSHHDCHGYCIEVNQRLCCNPGSFECNYQCVPVGTLCCEAQYTCPQGYCSDEPCPGCGDGNQLCNNKCIPATDVCCPAGQKERNKACIDQSAVCCPSGQKECNGACVQANGPCCPTDQKPCQNWCIGKNATCCHRGYKECNSACIPSWFECCTAGQRQCDRKCMPTGSLCCADSHQFDCNGRCVKDASQCKVVRQ